ncbi:hypothetical protein HZS92_04562 [Xanthomonas citri pv. citri]|nr:hypothetical protein HZS91_04622 [Xanthomonas citri pv. citri]QYF42405.1 hypothetical protein HZS92_04562 [Xanthomonas citri pv. citri]QYF47242.1 hypothetical protein HZS93_04623 [Xanthomonas citri]
MECMDGLATRVVPTQTGALDRVVRRSRACDRKLRSLEHLHHPLFRHRPIATTITPSPLPHPSLTALLLLLLLLLLLQFACRGPMPQRQGRQRQPAGRRAWMRDVFVRDMDVPYKNFCRTCAPAAPQARRARGRGVLSFGYFSLHKQRKVTRARKGVKALLYQIQPVTLQVPPDTSPSSALRAPSPP